jgi:PKD repeat protein
VLFKNSLNYGGSQHSDFFCAYVTFYGYTNVLEGVIIKTKTMKKLLSLIFAMGCTFLSFGQTTTTFTGSAVYANQPLAFRYIVVYVQEGGPASPKMLIDTVVTRWDGTFSYNFTANSTNAHVVYFESTCLPNAIPTPAATGVSGQWAANQQVATINLPPLNLTGAPGCVADSCLHTIRINQPHPDSLSFGAMHANGLFGANFIGGTWIINGNSYTANFNNSGIVVAPNLGSNSFCFSMQGYQFFNYLCGLGCDSFFSTPSPGTCVANFIVDTVNSHSGQVVLWNMSAIPMNPAYEFHWDFGDGNSSNAPFPIHTYAAPGVYTVCMVVDEKDASGNTVCLDTICEALGMDSVGNLIYKGTSGFVLRVLDPNTIGAHDFVPKDLPSLTVFPNPASAHLKITSELQLNEIEIVDLRGMVVSKEALETLTNEIQIPIDHLPSGHYFIRVQTANGMYITERFLKK